MSDRYPDNHALETFSYHGLECAIIRHSSLGHLCGYVRFPKRRLRETGYDGIVTYVPVHGGITFASEGEDGSMVYGFDCAHLGDAPPPEFDYHGYRSPTDHVWQPDEVRREIKRMVDALIAAPKYEARYLRCMTNKGKAKAIDDWLESIGEKVNAGDNFGLSINILGGEL